MAEDLKENRARFLGDVPLGSEFWMSNGTICRNIFELAANIRGLNDYTFRYHVNSDRNKNDFGIWIRETLGDKILYEHTSGVKQQDRYIDIIEQRIKEYESA